jgi:plasmid stabilization system protein ParE
MAEAALWYESRSLGLGADFLRAVDVCLSEIQRSPDRFPQVYRQGRRALVRRFPYAVYFVSTATTIQVVACMHVRRDPRRWQERVGR